MAGASATGGKTGTGGATSTIATGGSTATAGASSTGGKTGTGGATSTSTAATGGSTAVAGASSTGGNTGTGGATSTAATGGSTATAGASATGGTSAAATGGVAATGGSAAATGGVAATGGTSGTSTTPLTLDEACTKICSAQSTMTCVDTDCQNSCVGPYGDGTIGETDLYLAMVRCEAQKLTAATNYFCSDGSFFAPVPAPPGTAPSPIVNATTPTACQTEICAYTCAEANGNAFDYDTNVWTTCNCPP